MGARKFPQDPVLSTPRSGGRRYLRTFFALVLPALAILVGITVVQDPVGGDMTRVGGYSENSYGWNSTHRRFDPPLVSTAYDSPHDVVIIGDSYSVHGPGGQTDPGAYWTNYVAQLSGLSVAVINNYHMTLRELLDHPVYRQAPPRVLILEIVERYLIRFLVYESAVWIGEGFEGCPVPGPSPRVSLRPPLEAQPVAWRRETGIDFNFARAVDMIWESAWRRIGGVNRTRAHVLPLDNDTLFSNAAADRLLIYDDEFREADWPEAKIAEALCRLRAIQAEVESNGQTAFLLVSPPNKLNVYAPNVTDPAFRDTSKLAAFYADPHVNQVRLLEPMREAVRCGTVDVYLPNDTHWGTPGHELVARETVAALARLGVDTVARAARAGTQGDCSRDGVG